MKWKKEEWAVPIMVREVGRIVVRIDRQGVTISH